MPTEFKVKEAGKQVAGNLLWMELDHWTSTQAQNSCSASDVIHVNTFERHIETVAASLGPCWQEVVACSHSLKPDRTSL